MVDGREGAVEPANLASSARETFECLRRGHFVHNVPVHSECERSASSGRRHRIAVFVTTDLSMYMMVVPSSATWTTWLSNTYMHSSRKSVQATYRRDRHAGVKVRRKARELGVARTLSYRVRGPVYGWDLRQRMRSATVVKGPHHDVQSAVRKAKKSRD